jgi:hypothetical protein
MPAYHTCERAFHANAKPDYETPQDSITLIVLTTRFSGQENLIQRTPVSLAYDKENVPPIA